MNPFLTAVIVFLVGGYAVAAAADWLNVRALRTELPEEFQGVYDAARYARSQRYLRDKTRLSLAEETSLTAATVAFILCGGFGRLDALVRSAGLGEIATGLLFAAALLLALQLLTLPFSVYGTFVVEERYGFNRTTPGTFVLDILKSWLLAALLGGPVFAAVLWFFASAGAWAWLYCWGGIACVQALLAWLAPAYLMPLFNKFTPLPAGELRSAIEAFAASQRFPIRDISVMDGSRRSTKSNAFFAGFGRLRRLVLFDTLIARSSVPELLAVLAHEIGHYKEGHILKGLLYATAVLGLELFLLSWFIGSASLAQAFGLPQARLYAGIFFFGLLFTPISMVLSVVGHARSRRWEFDADAFARRTAKAEDLRSALKKLSVDNLANLTPHPFKVWLSYTHPPILDRLRAL